MDIPTQLPANANEVQTHTERGLTIACVCVVALVLFLRTVGRYCLKLKYGRENMTPLKIQHFLGLDDVFNLLAVLTFFGLAIAVLTAIDRGMGTHVGVVLYYGGMKGLGRYNQAIYVCAIFYNTTLGMVKLSVLCLYRRILVGARSKTLEIVNWIAFGVVAFNTFANVMVAAFQCNPIVAAWDLEKAATAKCINTAAFYLGNAITGIITDSLVYGLSIPIIKPLQMDSRTKLQTLVTLLIGAFAVITSAIRLSFLPSLLKNPDTTWAMGVPMDWSVVEPTVGILVSSMPAIRAIRYIWTSELMKSGGSNGSRNMRSVATNGHIQLDDMQDTKSNLSNLSSQKGAKVEFSNDNDSEEQLVYGMGDLKGQIVRKTEVELSYGPR